MGHHPGGATGTYAIGEEFPTVVKVLEEIIGEIDSAWCFAPEPGYLSLQRRAEK